VVQSSSRTLGASGSKSDGEHRTLLGLTWAALLGPSRSDWSEELEFAMLLISIDAAVPIAP
jgi:hypothetical protein